jgi:predicted MarR family transcription regulator
LGIRSRSSAAGIRDLTTLDVLLLHHVNHRAREKKLSDISFMLNIEDIHVVRDRIREARQGSRLFHHEGQEYIHRYREIREACLVSSLRADGSENPELGELARFLRGLSGLYDQAARAATSL